MTRKWLSLLVLLTTPAYCLELSTEYAKELGQKILDPIYGYDAKCPKLGKDYQPTAGLKSQDPYICGENNRALTLSIRNYQETGVPMQTAEEWLWLREAIRIDQKNVETKLNLQKEIQAALANPRYLEKRPELSDSVRNLKSDLERAIQIEVNLLKIKDCRKNSFCEDMYGGIKSVEAAEKEETLSRDIIYLREPALAQDSMRKRIVELASAKAYNGRDYSIESPESLKALTEAVSAREKYHAEQLKRYNDVTQNESKIAQFLNEAPMEVRKGSQNYNVKGLNYKKHLDDSLANKEILADLMASDTVRNWREGSAHKHAYCRIEGRIRTYDVRKDALIFGGTLVMGVGPLALVRPLAMLSRAQKVARSLAVVSSAAVPEAIAYEEKEKECLAHRNRGELSKWEKCSRDLSDQVLLSVATGGIGARVGAGGAAKTAANVARQEAHIGSKNFETFLARLDPDTAQTIKIASASNHDVEQVARRVMAHTDLDNPEEVKRAKELLTRVSSHCTIGKQARSWLPKLFDLIEPSAFAVARCAELEEAEKLLAEWTERAELSRSSHAFFAREIDHGNLENAQRQLKMKQLANGEVRVIGSDGKEWIVQDILPAVKNARGQVLENGKLILRNPDKYRTHEIRTLELTSLNKHGLKFKSNKVTELEAKVAELEAKKGEITTKLQAKREAELKNLPAGTVDKESLEEAQILLKEMKARDSVHSSKVEALVQAMKRKRSEGNSVTLLRKEKEPITGWVRNIEKNPTTGEYDVVLVREHGVPHPETKRMPTMEARVPLSEVTPGSGSIKVNPRNLDGIQGDAYKFIADNNLEATHGKIKVLTRDEDGLKQKLEMPFERLDVDPDGKQILVLKTPSGNTIRIPVASLLEVPKL